MNENGVVDKEAIEQKLLSIQPAIQQDGGDFEILNISDDGVVRLRIKGTKNNKPRTRETQMRLLDYVLRKDPEISGYKKIEKVDWETPKPQGLMERFMDIFR